MQSFDYEIQPIFQEMSSLKNGLHYFVYYIWYIAFMGSNYFVCVKKTIEQIHGSMCLFLSKLFLKAYSSVQNILFYNKSESESKV